MNYLKNQELDFWNLMNKIVVKIKKWIKKEILFLIGNQLEKEIMQLRKKKKKDFVK